MLPAGGVPPHSEQPGGPTLITECDCGQRVEAPASFYDRKIACPTCGKQILVGALSASEQAKKAKTRGRVLFWIFLFVGLVVITGGAGLYLTADAFAQSVIAQRGAVGAPQPHTRSPKELAGSVQLVAWIIAAVGLLFVLTALVVRRTGDTPKSAAGNKRKADRDDDSRPFGPMTY